MRDPRAGLFCHGVETFSGVRQSLRLGPVSRQGQAGPACRCLFANDRRWNEPVGNGAAVGGRAVDVVAHGRAGLGVAGRRRLPHRHRLRRWNFERGVIAVGLGRRALLRIGMRRSRGRQKSRTRQHHRRCQAAAGRTGAAVVRTGCAHDVSHGARRARLQGARRQRAQACRVYQPSFVAAPRK